MNDMERNTIMGVLSQRIVSLLTPLNDSQLLTMALADSAEIISQILLGAEDFTPDISKAGSPPAFYQEVIDILNRMTPDERKLLALCDISGGVITPYSLALWSQRQQPPAITTKGEPAVQTATETSAESDDLDEVKDIPDGTIPIEL